MYHKVHFTTGLKISPPQPGLQGI